MTQKRLKEKGENGDVGVYTIIDTSEPTISIAAKYFEKYIEAIFDEVSGKNY